MAGTIVEEFEWDGGLKFIVVIYDLLAEPVDAIVNAANGRLAHGGGVAEAIATAAGPALERECRKIIRERGPLKTGEAVVTTAGKLPFKGVIHTVGPKMGEGDEEAKLVRALTSAFVLAHEKGWKSVSFPGVSAGIFAVPHSTCSAAYIRAVVDFFADHTESPLKTIRLCLLKGPLLEAVKKSCAHLRRGIAAMAEASEKARSAPDRPPKCTHLREGEEGHACCDCGLVGCGNCVSPIALVDRNRLARARETGALDTEGVVWHFRCEKCARAFAEAMSNNTPR
jgi:O-acetyl-ADP-ribose deacetylase